MTRCKLVVAFGCSLLMGLAGAVRADTSDADLRAELDRVKSRLAELEGKQDANWLNEQRAEEIKGLVRDVINDADTRASLLADGRPRRQERLRRQRRRRQRAQGLGADSVPLPVQP